MSVLVDTSVWIRFLAKREPYATLLDHLLSEEDVVGHEFVFGELLIGDTGQRSILLEAYETIRQAKMVAHTEVVEFVRERSLSGRGVGWIDVHLLASAIIEGHQLLTADKPLTLLARELGVAFD